MIRLRKPVKLLEWGEGTRTTNQVWSEVGSGRITKSRMVDGLTTLTIELDGEFNKNNQRDTSIKLVQQGEGMTARSQHWGEVAMGHLKSIDVAGGKTIVSIEIPTAIKIDKR